MKVVNSLKSAKTRDKNCRVVRRKGRVYVINKANPRFKARQGCFGRAEGPPGHGRPWPFASCRSTEPRPYRRGFLRLAACEGFPEFLPGASLIDLPGRGAAFPRGAARGRFPCACPSPSRRRSPTAR